MTSTGLPGIVVAAASADERRTYLRKVLAISCLGLLVAGVVGVVSMVTIALNPGVLRGWGPMLIILGCWAVTNFVAQPMVFGARKWAGFFLGTATQGIALGFLLLVAVVVSRQDFGNPLVLIGMALTLTVVAGIGIASYVMVERRELSFVRAALSAVFLPMLVLMAVTFAFPNALGGPLGIVVNAVFVLVSAAALLYRLNTVVHQFSTEMTVEGGYLISIGVIVLFWNILSLLLRLRRR